MAFDWTQYNTPADPAGLEAQSQNLLKVAGDITGRGGDLYSTINAGAMEYSDIVADPIQARNTENQAAWLAGTQAAFYGSRIVGLWGQDVRDYRSRLLDIQEEYDAAASSNYGVTPVSSQAVTAAEWTEYTDKVDGARAAAEAKAHADAKTAQADMLDAKAELRGGQLTGGPTPENLKMLVEAGELGWAGFNLWGAESPTPLDGKDGTELANMLKHKLEKGDELSAADRELLVNLLALGGHAQWLQANGGKLTDDEIEFLKTVYDGLGTERGHGNWGEEVPYSSALFDIDGWLKDNDIAPEDAALVRESLGGGLLALSDEGIGGGFGMLPSDVQDLLNDETKNVDDFTDGFGGNHWQNWAPLASLLVMANPKLIGGTEFSAKTTLRLSEMAGYLDGAGGERQQSDADRDALTQLEGVLGVSTRNIEANTDLLTGKYQNQYGKDTPEYVLRELFGTEWTDDGVRAKNLIDWIPGAAMSGDKGDQLLAGKASAALIDITTNTKPTRWDESAFVFFTDSGGKFGDDGKAPLGVENPYIAQAMGDVTATYLNSFAEDNMGKPTGFADGHLNVDANDRARFMQLVAGDPTARAMLGDAVLAKLYDNAGQAWGADDDTLGDLRGDSGRLLGYYDAAIRNNMLDQIAGMKGVEQQEYIEKMLKHAKLDAITGGFLGFGGTAANTGIALNDARIDWAVHDPTNSNPLNPNKPIGIIGRQLPGIAQTALGFPVSEIFDPPKAPNPNDVTYTPVDGHIDFQKFKMMSNHAIITAGMESGKITPDMFDAKFRDEYVNEDGSLKSVPADKGVDSVNSVYEGVLAKVGFEADDKYNGTAYQIFKDLPWNHEAYTDYLQKRDDDLE